METRSLVHISPERSDGEPEIAGPLAGLRIIEIGGIGPGPFAGMMLADHGAEVIRVERADPMRDLMGPLLRSRKSVSLDLKTEEGIQQLRKLCRNADGVIEGFRPGVMERLGIGPDILLADNPKIVVGRMTGWGQFGPYSQKAGHDINYISISGVLGACARAGMKPVPPMNLLGDFGGGGMLLAFAMVSALFAVSQGGSGQVIDCAITDGSALLMTMIWGMKSKGIWNSEAGTNLLDTGAPFYEVYETRDGQFISIGPIEAKFYESLCQALGLSDDPDFGDRNDRSLWPRQKDRLAAAFRSRRLADWQDVFDRLDACVTPILSMEDALEDRHNVEREMFIAIDGIVQPAPAPRYSGTPCDRPSSPPIVGRDQSLLAQLG